MEVRAGYKQTEKGLIPIHWEASTIGENSRWLSGGTPRRSKKEFWNGTIPWISGSTLKTTEISTSDQFLTADAVATGSRMAPVDSTLLLVRGSALHNEIRAGLVVYPVAFNQDVKALVPVNSVEPKFLTYYILAHNDELLKLVSSAGNSAGVLDTTLVQNFKFLKPSRHEQRAIAAALSDVDALIAKLDQLIAKKRDLKQAAMQQLLTGHTRLPGFSGKWEVKRLGDLLRFQVGFPFKSDFFNQKNEGIRLVKNRDLKSDDQLFYFNGHFDSTFIVKDGDVLIGMDGDFLPCRWSKGAALLNQRVGRIVPTEALNTNFCYYRLIDLLKTIEYATSATTVKHLSHGDIENIECAMPKFDEQTAIATVLSDMDAERAALEARRDKTRALKQGMMQELLTGRIRLI